MKRRELLKCGIAGIPLFGAVSSVYSADSGEGTNVVLIMADDVGFECFGCYGSREYTTPRLDALAAGGIRFKNCHSTPLCTPSRVNLMSGKSNVFNYTDFGIYPAEDPTFANHFKEFGYATAVAGKWQLLKGKGGGLSPTDAGFDTYCLWNIPGTRRPRYWDPSFLKDGKLLDLPKGTYGPDVMTDFVVDFIESNTQKPFLVYFPMNLVHNPFLPTPDSPDRERKDGKKNFVDMVNYMDKCIGRIVDALEVNGLREKTLVVFTGDNGTNAQLTSELRGEQIPGGKGYTRDYGTHVPLIANWPGQIPAGQINDDLVCFSDFFPTIVEAAGLPPKEIADGDGWSFWPQCRGDPGRKREWIYCYYFPRPYAAEFDDKYRHFEARYVRDKRYKLYDNGEMYDTVNDVMETQPVSLDRAPEKLMLIRRKLQSALDSFPESGGGVDYDRVKGK